MATYEQMKKEIEKFKTQIDFIYKVRDTYYGEDKYVAGIVCDIVNNLLAYQNYLRYEKSYTETWLVEHDKKQLDMAWKDLDKAKENITRLEERIRELEKEKEEKDDAEVH